MLPPIQSARSGRTPSIHHPHSRDMTINAICGVNAPEVGGLPGGNDPVQYEDQGAEYRGRALPSRPLPGF